jgi:hypothetical protein
MAKPKVNPVAITLTIVVAVSVTGYIGYQFKRDRDIKESLAELERSKARTAQILGETSNITNADFIEIGTGWSYDRVKAVFRSDGKEVSRVELGGISTVVYQWTNADSSNAIINFKDGKLISKAQSGLK